jgi:hypothetical protein
MAILHINLILTVITVLTSVMVVVLWWPQAKSWRLLAPSDLLVVGITIAFLGAVGDNLFWGITWYSRLHHWPTESWWFDCGPYSNFVFRHVMKIAAAYCHIEAARRASVLSRNQVFVLFGGVGLLCLAYAFLVW